MSELRDAIYALYEACVSGDEESMDAASERLREAMGR